ncbi:hypothetical protein D1AOALGA4SA_1328 [Olavius algarvensis Delta 1 endosymbiont]|nr:hypothetical protein D1AOALGA4SA_1328 [Olavius algarvensis Delta 1 endosymbiont]
MSSAESRPLPQNVNSYLNGFEYAVVSQEDLAPRFPDTRNLIRHGGKPSETYNMLSEK